jgi:hypothetical protein
MLAMKSVLSRIVSVPTLVFDEVDTGIGGRTGSVLGDKLARLGAHVQVLCITHLPQIAARGAAHLYIEKQVQGARTFVQVACLDDEARVRELARMLGGGDTETVVQHAREMLATRPDGADEAGEIRGAANRAAASVPAAVMPTTHRRNRIGARNGAGSAADGEPAISEPVRTVASRNGRAVTAAAESEPAPKRASRPRKSGGP